MMQGRFTGWHMTAILVAFFGVVVAVNITMARFATGTFGGVVLENSYVASQEFNHWLAEAEASRELGWQVALAHGPEGRVALTVAGAPDMLHATGVARHPLGHEEPIALTFERVSEGQYLSTQALPAGRWILRLELAQGQAVWRGEEHWQ